MKKRYIFDEDFTLLSPDWTGTDQYFIDKFGEGAKPIMENLDPVLRKYERTFKRYDYNDLAMFLRNTTGLPVDEQDMKNWDELVANVQDTIEPNAKEVLEYLKSRGDSLAVLSNWFGDTQRERLERAGLLEYFDVVFGGDIITKPHKEAYWMASGGYDFSDCCVIGDDAETDYIGPKSVGMKAILYDRKEKYHKSLVKVRDLSELKYK